MTNLATPPTLTQDDLIAGYTSDEWCGFGYLGARNGALNSTDPEAPAQPDRVAEADRRVLAEAIRRGWSADDLFDWANSKRGRWFGDLWFGGSDADDVERHTADLMVLPGGLDVI